MRILLYIIRRTYGFNRSYAEIPLSDISSAIGVRREHIQKSLKKLSGKKIIEVRTYGGIKSQTISIIKDYQKWTVETCASCLLPKTATVAENGNTTVAENCNTTVAENCNSTYKENTKDSIKEKGERKATSPCHAGGNNKAFVNDDNYKCLVSEYGSEIIDKYIDRVDKWAFRKGKDLGECTDVIERWLEQDGVKKKDPMLKEYEKVINKFLPL